MMSVSDDAGNSRIEFSGESTWQQFGIWLVVAIGLQIAFWQYSMPRPQLGGVNDLPGNLVCCGIAVLLLLIAPLLVSTFLLKRNCWQLGCGWGDARFGWKAVIWLTPAFAIGTWIGSTDPQIQAFYPMPGDTIVESGPRLFMWFSAYLCYYIAFEFFYRGFMLRGVDRIPTASPTRSDFLFIGFQAFCCFLIHIGKPTAELWASLPASIVFGWVAIRSGSIWYGLIIHFAVGIVNDLGAA